MTLWNLNIARFYTPLLKLYNALKKEVNVSGDSSCKMFRPEMYFFKMIIVRYGFYVSIAILLLVSIGCVKKIPYEDYQFSKFRQRKGNLLLHFTTDKGQQVAFYLKARLK